MTKAKLRILVVGPEAGGTKLVTGLLRGAGAEVEHCSPMYRLASPQWNASLPHPDEGYDKIVVVIRHGPWRERAAEESGHTPRDHPEIARWWAIEGLRAVFEQYHGRRDIFICTLESLIYEKPWGLAVLLEDLGLGGVREAQRLGEEIGNPNQKWWGGEYFRDERQPWERGVNT